MRTTENIEGRSAEAGFRVALGVTGGVAAYKAAEVLRGLQTAGCQVRVAMTKHATKFIAPLTFRSLSGEHVIVDDYAPDNPDPIAHISFSQTCDLLLVAPATANIIAKFANGIADDFLTSTYLASTAPVLVAPAMNTAMWAHPATRRNLDQLRRDGVHIVEPDAGLMACGTVGPGRLAEPAQILEAALRLMRAEGHYQNLDLADERLVITAGATREQIDPVRFLSNRSSGRMGFAIAEAAAQRGAKVTVVAGATSAPAPDGVRMRQGLSAAEMHRAVMEEIKGATIFIGAAAVADYTPRTRSTDKIKKSDQPLTLVLEPTVDILAEVAIKRHAGLLVVGFAAETGDLLAQAREKLQRKRVDMMVANDVSGTEAGFDAEKNRVMILTQNSDETVDLPLMHKRDVADRILDEIARLRREAPVEVGASR